MSAMTLSLFGSPSLIREGTTVPMHSRKCMALLAYLAVTGTRHSRESLAALFWPEVDAQRARGALRSTLSRLRRSLGGAWLATDRETLGLDGGEREAVDVLRFRDLLSRCRSHGHSADQVCPDCLPLLSEAERLYQADFLSGFTLRDSPGFDEWQSFQTESLRRELAGTLERLAEATAVQGDLDQAIACARRWVALDPLEEEAHRALMRLYALSGRQGAAVRQTEEVERVLGEELGVAPSARTVELGLVIRQGQGQQLAAGLPALAPVTSGPRHNLPSQATPFVGREAELAQIAQLLSDPSCRLLTLVGPGGIGKTRLAIQAAEEQVQAFSDGVRFVPLVALDSPQMLASSIVAALDVPLSMSLQPEEQLLSVLRERQMLLLLDNVEHLLAGVGLFVRLLQGVPGIKLLVTSRERLNLREEWLLPLRGMRFPGEEVIEEAQESESRSVWRGSVSDESLSVLEGYNALRLFLQCARRVRPDFSLATAGASWVARICQMVEGMPLAIELAAPWVRAMSCRAIAQEIEGNLDLLTTTAQGGPERHRSMRAVFDRSWGLLTPEECDILRRLSVFRGGFRRQAAEEVAGASLAELSSLVDRSWVRASPSDRYEMHELVRQYCADRLDALGSDGNSEKAGQARDRHSRYFAGFLGEREHLLLGRRQKEAFQEILEDMDNVWAAWNWAMEREHFDSIGKCVRALEEVAELRGWHQDVHQAFNRVATRLRQHLRTVADRRGDAPQDAKLLLAEILRSQSMEAYKLGARKQAKILCEESLDLLNHVRASPRQRRAVAYAKGHLGWVLWTLGESATGDQLMREAAALAEEVNDSRLRAAELMLLAATPHHLGRYQEAVQLLEQALATAKDAGDLRYEAWCMENLSEVILTMGEHRRASRLAQEALQTRQDLGDRAALAPSLSLMGAIAVARGDYELARQHYRGGLAIASEVGDPDHTCEALGGLGMVALALGHPADAKTYLEESLALSSEMGKDSLGSLIGLGHALSALGDLDRSRQYFYEALELAMNTQQILEALDALVGLASLTGMKGDSERAIELLALALQHPASMQTTKDRAQALLQQLESTAAPETSAATTARGEARELEEVAAELLRER